MKFQLKSCLAICLLAASAQAFASQVPCPSPEVIALYSDRIDTIQSLGWNTFALITGTDLFASPIYDDVSNRYWRFAAEVAVEKGGFNAAYHQGTTLIKSVTTNMNKFAEEHQEGVYTCTYGRDTQELHVFAFSPMDSKTTNSQLIKAMFRHT